MSYARDIAARYGISREKLVLIMRERAVIDMDEENEVASLELRV